MDIVYIDTNEALALSCDTIRLSKVICIDTEFHRETTYYPELALIQVSDGEQTCCIDPLGITDFTPFLALLSNSNVTKVLHASGQDLEIFNHLFNTLPSPMFDTQIAAGLLGYGDQIGYAALIKKELNIDIDKSQSRTDWLRRPLNKDQLLYAASDVYYLAKAYPKMVAQLDSLNRLEWLHGDFSELCMPAKYQVDTNNIWKKVKGNQKLHGIQLAILQAVAAWREESAQKRNRPRRRIVPDDALIDIARLKPDSADKIKKLRSLNKTRLNSEDASQLLQRMNNALRMEKEHWPKHAKRHKLNMREEAIIDSLISLLKLKADEHHITPLNLASRKELESLLQGNTDIPLMQGWRYTHAGQVIEEFLNGRSFLKIISGELKLQVEEQ
ncbi:MAG: ribonuclease D [endosymbiont of Galathealinum brachiosum]|uniref:Ribonuclease D n=1 Tax=endosymbiont of Galathealinum brachiosum TaxID=2200906 RepID=A0A370D977_9GAMM|nr:MAG: ribonuclease D [endosymbiont of Galathealinum brachiosum]